VGAQAQGHPEGVEFGGEPVIEQFSVLCDLNRIQQDKMRYSRTSSSLQKTKRLKPIEPPPVSVDDRSDRGLE